MGLGRQQRLWEALRALEVVGVKGLDREAEASRIAADVVQRQQPQVAVEGGVLLALGRDRRRGLLEAHDELVLDVAAVSQQQRLAQIRRGLGGLQSGYVGRIDDACSRLRVGAVNRQRGESRGDL